MPVVAIVSAEDLGLDYSGQDMSIEDVRKRLAEDAGGDFEDIAAQLKNLPICAACSIEGQAGNCVALAANKLGRRLQRLIERAK